jgi:hypothetical protein
MGGACSSDGTAAADQHEGELQYNEIDDLKTQNNMEKHPQGGESLGKLNLYRSEPNTAAPVQAGEDGGVTPRPDVETPLHQVYIV